MKTRQLKLIYATLLLAITVFGFAAGTSFVAQDAYACACNCYVCDLCLLGCFTGGRCQDVGCPPAPCCFAPSGLPGAAVQ